MHIIVCSIVDFAGQSTHLTKLLYKFIKDFLEQGKITLHCFDLLSKEIDKMF